MKSRRPYFQKRTTESGRSDDRPRSKKIDQKRKFKLRHTREWHDLKQRLIKARGLIDELTCRELANDDKLTCHHMNLRAEQYGEFSKDDDFMLLTEMSHRVVHWLWQITNGEDFSILDRLRATLERMKELTDEDSWTGHVSDPHGLRDDDPR